MKAAMKTWLFPLSVALGFTTLCCDSLLPFSGWVAFHWCGSPSNLFLAGMIDFLCIWLLLAAALHRLRKPSRLRNVLWAAMLAFAPSFLMEKQLVSEVFYIPATLHRSIDIACLLLWLAMVTLFYRAFAVYAERLMLIYAFLAVSGLVLLGHALQFGWSSRHLNPPFQSKLVDPALHPSPHRPRILWIVMDELPYQFLFERRPSGLALPAFNALAHTSTVFTNSNPAAFMTEYAMPSYLTGIKVTSLSQQLDGTFSLHDAGPTAVPFNQHKTIFQDARDAGYSTAVAGWAIPYCRILPDVLDRCYWLYSEPLANGMSGSAGLASNMAAPFLFAAPHLLPAAAGRWLHLPTNRHRRVDDHIQEYMQLRDASERLLRDPSLEFVLLHLPIPHSPGIYDRTSGSLRYVPNNSFISNLALADRCLAELRAVLEETHQWDDTTILLMGDHGWRSGPFGELHDPIALLDHRQAYILKLPRQTTAQIIDAPYNATRTRALLRTLMQQTIKTPADLHAWIQSSP
jgi:hypothetical protein